LLLVYKTQENQEMKITVKQLKGLIREAVEEAMLEKSKDVKPGFVEEVMDAGQGGFDFVGMDGSPEVMDVTSKVHTPPWAWFCDNHSEDMFAAVKPLGGDWDSAEGYAVAELTPRGLVDWQEASNAVDVAELVHDACGLGY
jgi:hypothetical protein